MNHVFISHSSDDRELVEREVVSLLKKHGIQTWYSRDSIPTATQWERMIVKGLKTCDWFLLVMSPRSAKSQWVKTEVDWAMEHRADHIVPVMLEPCDPTDFHLKLQSIQYADFKNDIEYARGQLLATWGIHYIPKLLKTEGETTEWPPLKKLHRVPPAEFRSTYRSCLKMLRENPNRRLLDALNTFIDAVNSGESDEDQLERIGDDLQEAYFQQDIEDGPE